MRVAEKNSRHFAALLRGVRGHFGLQIRFKSHGVEVELGLVGGLRNLFHACKDRREGRTLARVVNKSLPILFAVLLCGCMTPISKRHWVQSGKTDAAQQAIKECRFEASKIVYPGNPLIEIDKQIEVFKACMDAKGYTLAD
jgi:hypothetical protein